MAQFVSSYEEEVYQFNTAEDSPEVEACRSLLEKEPGNVQYMVDLALALKKQMRYRDAIELFSEALMWEPFNAGILVQRSLAYLGLRAYRQSAAGFELALRVEPNNWSALYHIGLCWYLMGRYDMARKYYERCYAASEQTDKLVAVMDWYWLTLMHLGDRDGAQKLLERLDLNWDYGDNERYFIRLQVYKGLKTPEEAIARGRTGDSLNFCTYGYGTAYYMWAVQGRHEEAEKLMAEIAGRTDEMWTGFALQAAQAAMKNGI